MVVPTSSQARPSLALSPPRLSLTALATTLTAALVLAAWPRAAAADAVIDWNLTMDQAAPAVGGPPLQNYLGALVHIAMHDALNSIDPRYRTYSIVPTAGANAHPDAALAAAARDVLIHELSRAPETAAKATARGNVEAAYAARLAAIANGPAKDQGVLAGQQAAAAILQARVGDGSDTPHLPYLYGPGLGVYQPTPPNFPVPQFEGYGQMKPFTYASPAQFRAEPSPIFNLKGIAYTLNYIEVKTVGNALVRGTQPNSAMSDIARFWPGGAANWNLTYRTIVNGLGMDRWQHARLFALLEIAQTDGVIATFNTKYAYRFWRPATAIRWANDGNPLTQPDPAWLSFLPTPPYPDYPCGLPTQAGAATEVMRRVFGTNHVPYTLTVNAPAVTLPPPLAPLPAKAIQRSYASLSQAALESASARVYAGIHFRQGCIRGVQLGSEVARHVVQTTLQPIGRPR